MSTCAWRRAGQPIADVANRPDALFKVVSPAYFQTLGMRVRRGRGLADSDVAGATPVVVINETVACPEVFPSDFSDVADMPCMPSVVSELVEPIVSVVYVSAALPLMSEEDLVSILRVSRRNNEREGITGMLLYKDGNFMQVLEGPESKVSNRLEVICKDSRHRRVLRLVTLRDQERSFKNWSMGFRNLSSLGPEELRGYTSFLSASFLDGAYTTEPSRALKLLNLFKHSMR